MKQKLTYKKIFFIFSFFVCTVFLSAQEEKTYSYEDLKSELFKNNPQLLNLQEEYFRSTLDVKDAWASLGPTIDLQLSGTYMLNPPVDPIYLNVDELFGAIQWPNGIKPNGQGQYVKIYDGMENTMYNIQLSLMQPLFTWGKIGNSIKLYKQISGVKELQLLSTQEQLENELKIRLVTLCRLYEIIDLIEEAETFTNRMVEFSENAEKSGMMIHQDVVDAKVQAKQLEISKQELNEQIKNQLLEIQKITGLQNLNRNQIDYSVDEHEILSVMALNRTEVLENATSSQQKSIKIGLARAKQI